jgi:hypothetical protein
MSADADADAGGCPPSTTVRAKSPAVAGRSFHAPSPARAPPPDSALPLSLHKEKITDHRFHAWHQHVKGNNKSCDF